MKPSIGIDRSVYRDKDGFVRVPISDFIVLSGLADVVEDVEGEEARVVAKAARTLGT